MKKIKRLSNLTKIKLFTVLFLAIAMVAVTIGISSAKESEPKYGGTLRILTGHGPYGFDVIKAPASLPVGDRIGNLVMEKLFDRGDKGELIPVLGLSATPSADGKTWTIKLRKGVKFHDGTLFSADAVVKHWQRILNPENRFRQRIHIMPILSVQKTGDYEVQFLLKHAWLPFTDTLSAYSGYASLIPSPKAVEDGTQHRAPVGTGKFAFKEWKNGDRIVLTKNSDYREKGRPFLDEVVYLIIPDHDSRYAALISGQADMMPTDRPTHVEKLTKDSGFSTYITNNRGCFILAMNNTKPPLNDARVRKAIALVWDQKKYHTVSYKGMVPYTESWLGDLLKLNDTGYLHHDLKKARALMAEYGKPVELEYIHTASARGRTAGMIIQQMMKQIGIKITPVSMDFAGNIQRLFSGQFDMTSWFISGAYDMGPNTVASFYSKSPWNVSRYSSEKVDKLLIAQRQSTDPAAREKILNSIVKEVNSDAPFIYLNGMRYYLFARNYVKNISKPVPGIEGISGNRWDIWLDK